MKIFVDRPIATLMVFLVLLVLGVYSYFNIPIELAPTEVEYPRLTVHTSWYGVPPQIIQTEITSLLEEKSASVKGVRKIESSSSIGNSSITLEFDPKTDMEFARLSLREKFSEIKDELPYGVRPQIEPYIPEDFRVEPFLSYTISGDYSLQKLRKMVKEPLEIGIGSIKGVADVQVTGGSDPEIRIILDEDRCKSLGIQPYRVQNVIQERNRVYEAGRAWKGNRELLFKVHNPIRSLRDLGETIVWRSGENPVKLKDVARLEPAYGEIYYINRINGQPTISLTVHKESGVSTLKVGRAVKSKLDEVKSRLPEDLVFREVNDESEEIDKNLNDFYLLVGIIVVVIFLLIYLVLGSLVPSLLVLSSIAFSVLLTFNLVYFTKTSLNMFTLGGLALGFGLFVDNAIVVFENIWRHREGGALPREAAIIGAKEVFLPVLASTLTTISVFFSIAYFHGRLRLYYFPLAVVLASALGASLLVSFSVIPALTPRLMKREKIRREPKVRRIYARGLRFLIRHPLEVLLVLAAIFLGSYKWFRSEVTLGEFFSWYSKERLMVSIGMPAGTEIERTDEVIHQFEEIIVDKTYEKEANTSIQAERGYIIISFPPEIEMSYHPYLLKEELIQLATNFAGINIGIYGFDPQGYSAGFGSGTYYDSNIRFFGYNLKKLGEMTSGLERTLKRNPRIKDVKITSSRYGWWRQDSFEYVLKIDKVRLRKYDIDPLYIYYQIYSFIQSRSTVPLKVKVAGTELDFSIKFPQADKMDLKNLRDVLIQTRTGEFIRLGDISFLEEKPIAGSIDREDQQFQQTVMWEFRGPYKAGERYRKSVFERLELPPGFTATMEDERFLTSEEKGQIVFAIIFSIVIIFMILASLYESLVQPFFILTAIPLALIGVFIAFVVADFSFDTRAYIGVILLGGIVVNNSILLVDHINLKRKQGLPLLEAVLEGSRERIRPIVLTAGTTVTGMLPLVLIQLEEGKRQIWAPLALSAVGGLITSTVLILIAIPILYYYGSGLRGWAASRIDELREFARRL
jgi:HAE1 family hydrophobic/amphiphilic exporter-1